MQLATRPHVMQNWKKCKHLIIDEISMVNGGFFEVSTLGFLNIFFFNQLDVELHFISFSH